MREESSLAREIQNALEDEDLQQALGTLTRGLRLLRAHGFQSLPDHRELKAEARRIREETIRDLDALLDRFQGTIEARGGHVFVARDGEAACRYMIQIVRERNIRTIVKSKSMTAEEIALNGALEGAGATVIETDLGERIVQLAGERPSHLIGPAVHKTKGEVMELFARWLDLEEPPRDVQALARLARQALREAFFAAELGITGVNFAVADTGTLVLVENEGNIRLTAHLPPLHVAVMGLEKVVPSLDDLIVLLKLLPRSGTGQKLTSYVSLVHPTPEREFHLVILDNGRTRLWADPELSEALACIRCGACLDSCPSYQAVGGHVYSGRTYMGGIGCAWTAGIDGLEAAARTNELCTACGRCTEVCPVGIDIPWLNTVIKQRTQQQEHHGAILARTVLGRLDLWAPWGSRLAPLANNWATRRLAARCLGLNAHRHLPAFQRPTFVAGFRKRPVGSDSPQIRAGSLALFPDCFTNHFEPEVARSAVRLLGLLGIRVELAKSGCCGRAALSQGLVDRARALARRNVERLLTLREQGVRIVGVEPSCVAALRSEYRHLLPDEPTSRLGHGVFEVMEFLARLQSEDALSWPKHAATGTEKIVYHGHCQQKALGVHDDVVGFLRSVPGLEAETVDVSCCGMAGSFGYQRDFSSISRHLGRELARQLNERGGVIVASGFSCRAQIRELTGRDVLHPVQILARLLRDRNATTGGEHHA